MERVPKGLGGCAVMAVLALSGASPALAAPRHHRARHLTHARVHARRHASSSASSGSASAGTSTSTASDSSTTGPGETALTGSTLSSASATAVAAVSGGTVTSARTETDSVSGAAYEVHVTKSDGSGVLVIEDASFTVLATQADHGCGGGGDPQGRAAG